jgi:NAD(P)-dependent dehydrogenase (short-subunit alcohol dehydrogenase family)
LIGKAKGRIDVLSANAGAGHFGVNVGSIAAEEIDRITTAASPVAERR